MKTLAVKDEEALAPRAELGVVHADNARDMIRQATAVAKELANVIKQAKLANKIQGREYVRCEGWTSLAAMMGCTPREVSNESDEHGTYTAVVELVRNKDGAVLARASHECGVDEPKWAKMPRYARRSMAATRATGKACRLAFSWVMTLSGYQATPAEEMDAVVVDATPAPQVVVKGDRPFDDEPTASPQVPFGKNAGTPISDLTNKQLCWYLDRALDQLEQGEAKDADTERAWLFALDAEIRLRKFNLKDETVERISRALDV